MTGLRKGFVLGALIVAGLGGPARAAVENVTFFQFSADPNGGGANQPEFVYDPVLGLSAGLGATGNGSLLAPGLLGTITGGLAGIPFSPPGMGPGPTYNILGDLTLVLGRFAPVGSATVEAGQITQALGAGTFAVTYAGATPLVLLTGVATSALLTEKDTNSNASVLSGQVTYTGGLLLASLAAEGLSTRGVFSFGMTGLDGAYTTVSVGTEQHLAGFVADGVGTFDAIPIEGLPFPEPSLVVLGMGMVVMTRMRGRRTDDAQRVALRLSSDRM